MKFAFLWVTGAVFRYTEQITKKIVQKTFKRVLHAYERAFRTRFELKRVQNGLKTRSKRVQNAF